MTYLKLIPMFAAAGIIGGSLVASAGSPVEKFATMDTDASGLVSEAEFVAHATASGDHTAEEAQVKFLKIAGDDGAITLAELEAAYADKGTKPAHTGSAGS